MSQSRLGGKSGAGPLPSKLEVGPAGQALSRFETAAGEIDLPDLISEHQLQFLVFLAPEPDASPIAIDQFHRLADHDIEDRVEIPLLARQLQGRLLQGLEIVQLVQTLLEKPRVLDGGASLVSQGLQQGHVGRRTPGSR